MTILHTVIFAWVDGTTDADITRFERDLALLASRTDGIESFEIGRDAGFREGQADLVIVARFAEQQSLRNYLNDPYHHQILDDYARAMVARKESVQAVLP